MDSTIRIINDKMIITKLITNYSCKIQPCLTHMRDLKTPKFCLNSTIPMTCYLQIRFESEEILVRLVSQTTSDRNIDEPACLSITIKSTDTSFGGPIEIVSPKKFTISPEYFEWYKCKYNNVTPFFIPSFLKSNITIECVIGHYCARDHRTTYGRDILESDKESLYDRLERMFTEKDFADVKINIGDEEFWAHKAILARSPVFTAMFTNQMAENKDGVVKIDDIDPNVFQILLKFLYLGSIDLEIKSELIEKHTLLLNLLVAADKYQIDELKNVLTNFTIKYIDVNNVTDILIFADKYNIPTIRNESLAFIGARAKEVRETDGFKKMINSHTALATEILCFLMNQDTNNK